jgi:hypothetical protein
LKPAIAYPIENGVVAPIVQFDVDVWHRSLKCPKNGDGTFERKQS